MAPDRPESLAFRMQAVEHNIEVIFERLRVVDRLDERMSHMEGDLARATRDCAAVREWVEDQLTERKRMTSGEKIAYVTGFCVVAASILSALINTGAI